MDVETGKGAGGELETGTRGRAVRTLNWIILFIGNKECSTIVSFPSYDPPHLDLEFLLPIQLLNKGTNINNNQQ